MEVTLAFLPFKNLHSDKQLDLLVAGFVDDLIIILSKFKGLRIISPESTQSSRSLEDIRQIPGAQSGYTLSGNVRPSRQSIRIAIQLLRNEDGKVVFAHDFTSQPEVLFDLQEDIILQLVNVLQQSIDADVLIHSYQKPKLELQEYELYLMGMEALKKGGIEQDIQARQYFDQALKLNPHYAQAYTGISLSYFNEWSCQLWSRWDISQKGAHEYALKALELDDNDYIALAVAGRTYLFIEQYEIAEQCLRKSLKVNPNDAWNLVQIAFSMMYLELGDEGVGLYENACQLNPLYADRYLKYGANIYFEAGFIQKSLDMAKRVDPGTAWVDFPVYMAAAYYLMGDLKEMQSSWELFLRNFRQQISTSDASSQEALRWQKEINPYKGKTNLQSFWDFMDSWNGESTGIKAEGHEAIQGRALIRHLGDFWELEFKNHKLVCKDSKGLQDLRKLLLRPDEEFHCSELAGNGAIEEKGVEMFDNKAKTAYQKRIIEIQNAIMEAELIGDTHLTEQLHWEYEEILDHLSKSSGLGHKARLTSGSVDKIRSAVTLRIKSCIKKISKEYPALGKHLSVSIKTGTFCSYRPEEKLHWTEG